MVRSWCKVSASLDNHPKIRRAGNLGRQVFEFALRRNAELDRNGILPSEHLEAEYLADVLMLTKEQAESGLSQAVRTGLLAPDGGGYVITGWDDEWGKRPMTEAERKRNQRANQRERSSVTKCPDSIVAEMDSPECHGSEERREDQIRGDHRESATSSLGTTGQASTSLVEPPARRTRAQRAEHLPAAWVPRSEELALAASLGVDPAREAAAFRDHHCAKASRFADWNAAFRTWLRNAVKFNRGGGPGPRGGPASFFAIIDSLPHPADAAPEVSR